MQYYIDYCCTRYYLEFLGKSKFLTKAKNYYFDQLAKYYQKLKFIGRYYLEFLSKIKFLTKAKNYYFDQLAKYYQKLKFIGKINPTIFK